jgi:hypothetical protein
LNGNVAFHSLPCDASADCHCDQVSIGVIDHAYSKSFSRPRWQALFRPQCTVVLL